MCSTNRIGNMDSDAPPQQSLLEAIAKRKFPVKLWSLVNDPAHSSVVWDKTGEGIVIDQCLFEKEVLTQGCGLPDTFHSFHRQLNLYGFKTVHGCGIKIGWKYFYNPNFKRKNPELAQLLTRKTVKKSLKAVPDQKTHERPDEDGKLPEDVKGSESPVPLQNAMSGSTDQSTAQPPSGFQAGEAKPVDSQHSLVSSHTLIFPPRFENVHLHLVFQRADNRMPLPSPSNAQAVSRITVNAVPQLPQ